MGTYSGEITNEFNRTYIYLNPDRFKGPFVERLSNLASVGSIPDALYNLYAIPPIVSTESSTTAHLTFSIKAIPKWIYEPASAKSQKEIANNLINHSLFKSERAITNVNEITATPPVYSAQVGGDAVVYFNIRNLPNIDLPRTRHGMKVVLNLSYNSRSISAITASAPLEAITTGNVANVSFDMTSLPPA